MELNQRDEKSPFRNANLRKAISYSIDRKALVESILGDGSIEPNGLVPQIWQKTQVAAKTLLKSGSQIEYDTKKLKNTGKKRKRIGDFNLNNGYSFFRCRFF